MVIGIILGVLLLACFVYIVYECIHDCTPAKKALYLIIILIILGFYVAAICLIRLNPTIVAFRKQHDVGGGIIAICVLVFVIGMVVGSLLHKRYDDPKTTKEKVGYVFAVIAWYSRFVMLALLPLAIAFIID